MRFQSSPALSGRCNLMGRWPLTEAVIVSILTGPFGPVQRTSACYNASEEVGFNPHRPFRAGATYRLGLLSFDYSRFNPHRPFRAGATSAST